MTDYTIVKKLGAGEYGEVHLVRNPDNGMLGARKKVHTMSAAYREAQILRGITSAGITCVPHVLSVSYSRPLFYMDYIDGNTLRWHISAGKSISEREALRLMYVLFTNIAQLHSIGVVHRDIKPENILLTESNVYLVDFGLACTLPNSSLGYSASDHAKSVGTVLYMCPETGIRGTELITASDVYSAASCIAEYYYGYNPFDPTMIEGSRHLPQQMLCITCMNMKREQHVELLQRCRKGVEETTIDILLQRCLQPQARNLPTALEVAEYLRLILEV